MKILITNDDGVNAPGIRALTEVAREFGEVVVVAPDRERSACGHAMTLRDPLRVTTIPDAPCTTMAVNGLPVDCVNVGLTMMDGDCDLVLSGINQGPNLGFDVTYSGTVAGAMEGAINGIRSIALSMACFLVESPPHFETGAAWLRDHLASLIEVPLPEYTFLNVNVPAIAEIELRGQRIVRMGRRVYKDRVERRDDPWGRPYYWQGGVVMTQGDQPETDVQAVREGFVAITPITLDWTANEANATLERMLIHRETAAMAKSEMR